MRIPFSCVVLAGRHAETNEETPAVRAEIYKKKGIQNEA